MRFLKKCIKKLYHLIWFLSILLIFTPNVFAKTTINWAGEVSHTIDGWFSNCTSSSSCSPSGITQNSFLGFNDTSQAFVFPGLMSRLTSYNDNVGVQIGFSVGSVLKTDTLYSIRVYLCSGSVMHPLTWTTGNNDSDISNHTYYADTKTSYFNNSANPQPFEYYSITGSSSVGSPSFNSCRIHSVVFRPRIDSTFIGLQFNTDSSYTGNFWFIGYDLDIIGSAYNISSSDLNNAIQNSGLATANSVTQVQQSITQVQQELGSIDDSINNDNVDGANSQVDDLLNNSNFTDSTGIQSIINAPLNFINGLTNACSPINLTIPYIDTPVQLPCIKQELNDHIPLVVPVLSTAINGFIIYRILLDIVRIIKNARNPDDDRIEVLDL